jgi:pyruvate dehydrogenase E2 component (dihydrolipoamide acetyltransferase)
VLLGEDEDSSALDAQAPAAPPPAAAPPPQPQAPPPAAPPAAIAPSPSGNDGRILASPLARRMAEQAGLDLASLQGSGPNGRIVKRDIESAVAGGAAPPPAPAAALAAAVPATIADAGMPYTELPNTTMRKVIAQRLSESKRDVPHFYLSIDTDIDALLAMRAELNRRAPEGEAAYKLSVNDFVVRAVALALRQVPAANATWTDEAVRLHRDVDVSVAVATPGGLITPVVRGADGKGLAAISGELKDMAARARQGKLMPEEYQGGGFTVSNLGMYGVSHFSAIINPPQSCILAVGVGEARPVVRDGALAVATVMTCTLSVDHRSVDGVIGAEFLAAFKGLIEEPLTMLL